MGETWEQLQGILSAVLLVSTIIAGSFAGAMAGTIKSLKESVEARGTRIADLEGEVAREKADVARAELERDQGLERERATRDREVAAERAARVKAESEAELLKTMVTGKVELVAIGDLLDHHHKEALSHWSGIDTHIQELPEKIVEAMQEKP